MSTISELKELRKKIAAEKVKYNREYKEIIESETFFRKYPYVKAAIVGKLEMLDEMDKWLKDKIEKEIKFTMLMAEIEL